MAGAPITFGLSLSGEAVAVSLVTAGAATLSGDPTLPLGDAGGIGAEVGAAERGGTAARIDVIAGAEPAPGATDLGAMNSSNISAGAGLQSRVGLRVRTKIAIQEAQPKTAEGDYIDPNTGKVIPRNGPFDYGHRPGFEWWRTQIRAREEGWSRQQVIEYENDPTHYQIEDPSSNRSHMYEQPY